MVINHNIAALNTYRQFGAANKAQSGNMEKLSSGLRINRAGDDAAGLAISEKMRGQIRGLDMASKNAQDGISLIQTAEGALNETHSILQRMRELAVQAANDTNTDADRAELQKEVDQLVEEIDRIADTTEFNTKKLLNGELSGVRSATQSVGFDENNTDSIKLITTVATDTEIDENNSYNVTVASANAGATEFTITWTDASGVKGSATVESTGGTITLATDYELTLGTLAAVNIGDEATFTARAAVTDNEDTSLTYQIGANSSQTMRISIENMSAAGLNVSTIKIDNARSAEASISAIQKALDNVSAERSKLGAFQNRLDHTINNLGTSSENLTSAESRIRDVDMAKEIMDQTKNSILSQAAQAMLAQANQQPQGVLQLLQ